MNRSSTLRKFAVPGAMLAAGLIAGAVVAGTVSASASGGSTATTTASASATGAPRPHETPLTGTTADKVKAAVLAKYPGATIERLETDSDGAYEAHIVSAAGERVTVEVSTAFAVTGEEVRRAGGRGGPGHQHGTRPAELTGTPATKVKAAVLAKYPGATVEHMWKDAQGGYLATITTKDGTHVHVTLDDAYAVTGAEERAARGGRGEKDPQAATPTPSATS